VSKRKKRKGKKRGPKKRIELDDKQILLLQALIGMNAPNAEISSFFGCSFATLRRNYAKAINTGRDKFRCKLRAVMADRALKGDTRMCIWLSKNILGWGDRFTVSGDGGGEVDGFQFG